MKVRAIISGIVDPWFNLATEEWIYREMDPTVQTLFLWQNQNTVVIGRNQNPWSECNLERIERDDVKLARRTTGGGAVYHDLGNVCFTFLSPRDGYDRSVNYDIVRSALYNAGDGLSAEISGRNDLVVQCADGPRKISGSAYREASDRAFHHGTVLVNSDLDRLSQYLTPHPKKLESKGRVSVRARVANAVELAPSLTCEKLMPALFDSFFEKWSERCEIETLRPISLGRIPCLKETYERFSSWDWRFGNAPRFQQELTHYFSWGFVDLHLDVDHGVVQAARMFSDALDSSLVEGLETSLVGCAFTRKGAHEAAMRALMVAPERGAELAEFEAWFGSRTEV